MKDDSEVFKEWLIERRKQISEELKPYWEAYKSRESSGSNMYGIGTHADHARLDKITNMYYLLEKLESGQDVNQIATDLLNCSKEDEKEIVQLRILKEYQESFSPPKRPRR